MSWADTQSQRGSTRCGAAGYFLARRLVEKRAWWLDSALVMSSFCALGMMVCLFATIAPRSFRLPSPERYIESLPVLATIPSPKDQTPTRIIAPSPTAYPFPVPEVAVYEYAAGDFMVRRSCETGNHATCRIDATNPKLWSVVSGRSRPM